MLNKISALYIFSLLFFSCSAQDSTQIEIANNDTLVVDFERLAGGMFYALVDAPKTSIVNDSKIDVLKVIPALCEFKLLSSSEYDSTRTAPEWAKDFQLNFVINAGMYEASKKLANKGYMQNYAHFNNPEFYESYCAMIAFNPIDSLLPNFSVLDLSCKDWDTIKIGYNSFSQGMRMLDCDGEALTWNKKNQSCSMALVAMDKQGNSYFIFCRSPYTHNEMIGFLRKFPIKLVNAIYLEGGPETSFYLNVNGKSIEKNGSYISNSFPYDTNDHFWKLPNVIGIKVK